MMLSNLASNVGLLKCLINTIVIAFVDLTMDHDCIAVLIRYSIKKEVEKYRMAVEGINFGPDASKSACGSKSGKGQIYRTAASVRLRS